LELERDGIRPAIDSSPFHNGADQLTGEIRRLIDPDEPLQSARRRPQGPRRAVLFVGFGFFATLSQPAH
jgi:hypothetical protein